MASMGSFRRRNDRRPSTWARSSLVRLAAQFGYYRDTGPDGPATAADVSSAYRLLLGREPDPSGAERYSRRLAAGQLRRDELAEELVNSVEFARRHPHLVATRHPDVKDVKVDGFIIVVEPSDWAVGASIAQRQVYEPEVTAAVRSLLAPGGTFVDVGANIGWYSLLAASLVGPAGTVLAVEPNTHNCELLKVSCERNDFTNIALFNAAVSDRAGWVALETDASNGRVIPLGPLDHTVGPIACSYAVPAFTLDELLVARGILAQVDAVKVDVEGVETAVFSGASRLLGDVRPSVVFEWYPKALATTGGVDPYAPLQFLRRHGYAISVVGRPSGDAEGLSDPEIEAFRVSSGRDLLDLLARHRDRGGLPQAVGANSRTA